jgi:hypothetical protein
MRNFAAGIQPPDLCHTIYVYTRYTFVPAWEEFVDQIIPSLIQVLRGA